MAQLSSTNAQLSRRVHVRNTTNITLQERTP